MKTSVISKEFRDRYLSNPDDPEAFEGRAIVFDGPEDFHHNIDDEKLGIDEHCLLFMRGAGPIGYPGGAEVVNMRPPSYLLKKGIHSLPCLGDGRQSGTSGSPSVLNASPEAAAGGGLAILKNGDSVRMDLKAGTVNVLISEEEIAKRREALEAEGGLSLPRKPFTLAGTVSGKMFANSIKVWFWTRQQNIAILATSSSRAITTDNGFSSNQIQIKNPALRKSRAGLICF